MLNVVGLPPDTTSRQAHKRWWWAVHNAVSEHAASTRGGHPWVYEAATDAQFAERYRQYGGRVKCQNPWCAPWHAWWLLWLLLWGV